MSSSRLRKGSYAFRHAQKAQEAMMAAVEIYNSPLITFKTETSISLIIVAWTYLMQSYCIHNGIEIRQSSRGRGGRKYARDKNGEYKTLPFPELLTACGPFIPIGMKNNLNFIHGIRNRIQHYAGNEIDGIVAPKIQANVLDFDDRIRSLTDGRLELKSRVPIALQFQEISLLQAKELINTKLISSNLKTFISDFERTLTEDERRDTAYEAQVKFSLENKNRGSDLFDLKVVKPGDRIPDDATIVAMKEVEKPKYLPKQIAQLMVDEGHSWFTINKHTDLWKSRDAKKPEKGYGVSVSNQWYWYQRWVDEQVRPYCEKVEETIRSSE